MQKLIFENANGEKIDLTDFKKYGITDWGGLSETSLSLQTQEVPFNDGSVYLDSLLSEKTLTFTLSIFDNNDLENRYAYKRELISLLNPKLGEGYLYYTNDFLEKRIKVVPELPKFANKNSNDSGTLKASLSFTACLPYWEDVEETSILLNKGITNVVNNGDVPASVKIELNGMNGTFFKIKNLTENKKIELRNLTEKNIEINTGVGEKSVTGYNLAVAFNVDYKVNDICYDALNDIIYVATEEGYILSKLSSSNEWVKEYTNTASIISIDVHDGIIFAVTSDNKILKCVDSEWTATTSEYDLIKIIWCDFLNEFVIGGNQNSTGIIFSTSLNSEGVSYSQSESIKDFTISNEYIIVLEQTVLRTIDELGNRNSFKFPSTHNYSKISCDNFKFVLYSDDGYLCECINGDFTELESSVGDINFLIYDSTNFLWWCGSENQSLKYSVNLVDWTEADEEIKSNVGKYNSLSGDILFADTTISVFRCNGTEFESVGFENKNISDFTEIKYVSKYNLFIGIKQNYIYKSTDTKSWELLYTSQYTLNNICDDENGNIIFSSLNGYIIITNDCENFTAKLIDDESIRIDIVIVGRDGYVAFSLGLLDGVYVTYVYMSTDLNTWTKTLALREGSSFSIGDSNVVWAEGLNKYIMAGGLYSSDDAIHWERMNRIGNVTANTTIAIYNRNKNYVAISGHDGGYNITYDGINVIGMEYSVSDYDLYHGCFDPINSMVIFVGNYYIHWSVDGETWFTQAIEDSHDEGLIYYNPLVQSVEGYAGTYFEFSKENESNIISKLTSDSDMTFSLEVGNNSIQVVNDLDCSVSLIFRNKYLGV